jgi:transcriptional regulator with XRE-family HTH domain
MDELKARRQHLGLTLNQVASAAACSPAFLQMLEGGYRPTRSAVLPRVEAVLNDPAPAAEGPKASEAREANPELREDADAGGDRRGS